MALKMSRIALVSLIIGMAVVAGIIIAMIGYAISGERMLPQPPELDDFDQIRDDAGTYLPVKTAISATNMILSCALIFLYAQIYKNVKTGFALGLIFAMVALFLYALTSNPVVQMLLGYHAITGVGPFAWIADVFASIALAILLWLSLE